MKWTTALLWVAALAPSAAAPARAEWQVWTVTDTRRVLRDDAAEKSSPVKLAAARNEWESFQILVRANEPVAGVRVEPNPLTAPDGASIATADMRLYRQHQMHITEPTYRNDAFRPGWYPDPLVPFAHPVTGKPLGEAGSQACTGSQAGAWEPGGQAPGRPRLRAVPFDLPAGQTHGFWVDVCVPAKTKPGEYRGTFRVTATGRTAEIPVTLTVWDFELPSVPTFQTALGSPAERMRSYYRRRAQQTKEAEPADWDAVEAQCAVMLGEHRINATPSIDLHPRAQPDGSFRIPSERIAALREFVDRLHVAAINVPHPHSAVKDPQREKAKLHAWLKAFDLAAAELNRPHVLFYTYLRDEPNDAEAYRYVQQWGKAVREAKSVVKVLVVEQTKTQDPAWGDLYGAVDIWCPLFPLHDPQTAAQRLAQGEIVWTYTALCQAKRTPWWHLDFPLLNYRVPAWMAWNQRIRGVLYWGGMAFWNQVEDPWDDPKTLDRRKDGKGQLYNGEGTIVYPGRAAGYDGIAPSLRLKALRDAIEDYEYLAILERQGRRAEAEKIVASVAPSFFQWDPNPAAYPAARHKLAAMIIGGRP